jgi:FKBP-type peptidyl-prolyl cis-trans isomerase
MKYVRTLQATTLALALGALAPLHATINDEAAPTAEPVATAATSSYTNEEIFEAFGYLVGQRIGVAEFELTAEEKSALMSGLNAAFNGEKGKFNAEKYGSEIQRVLGARQTAAQAKLAEKAEGEAATYFAELKKNPKVLSTPSGLHYEVIQEGTGPKPTPENTVKVHYTGTLIDGTKFDSSVDRGEPVEFPLGGVIPGWIEGLQLVGAGGKLKLYIPAKLGYGPNPAGSIPPNSTLLFDVELLEIKAAVAPAPTNEATTEPVSAMDTPATP